MNKHTQNIDFLKVGTIPLHGNNVDRKQKKAFLIPFSFTVIAIEIPSHMFHHTTKVQIHLLTASYF